MLKTLATPMSCSLCWLAGRQGWTPMANPMQLWLNLFMVKGWLAGR